MQISSAVLNGQNPRHPDSISNNIGNDIGNSHGSNNLVNYIGNSSNRSIGNSLSNRAGNNISNNNSSVNPSSKQVNCCCKLLAAPSKKAVPKAAQNKSIKLIFMYILPCFYFSFLVPGLFLESRVSNQSKLCELIFSII